MKLRHLALAVLTLAAAGCAPDKMSLEAYAICAMPDTCKFEAECGTVHIGFVQFNSGMGQWLQFGLEVHNQVANNADADVGRVNSNDAHVTGYRLEYDGTGPGSFELPVGNQLVPAGSPSVLWIYAAPPGAPAGAYHVNISLIGYYDNGREFETDPFPVALQVAAYTFGCPTLGDVDVCPGTGAQSIYACGTP